MPQIMQFISAENLGGRYSKSNTMKRVSHIELRNKRYKNLRVSIKMTVNDSFICVIMVSSKNVHRPHLLGENFISSLSPPFYLAAGQKNSSVTIDSTAKLCYNDSAFLIGEKQMSKKIGGAEKTKNLICLMDNTRKIQS